MKEYIIAVILGGMVGAVITQLAPTGEMKRYVKIAVSLVLVIVCISPLRSFMDELQSLELFFPSEEEGERGEEYREILEAGYGAAEVENLRVGIKAFLSDRFGVEESEVTVSVRISEEGGERRVERVFLTLYGSAIWKDTGEMERALGDLLGCEVITAVG